MEGGSGGEGAEEGAEGDMSTANVIPMSTTPLDSQPGEGEIPTTPIANAVQCSAAQCRVLCRSDCVQSHGDTQGPSDIRSRSEPANQHCVAGGLLGFVRSPPMRSMGVDGSNEKPPPQALGSRMGRLLKPKKKKKAASVK